MMKLMRYVILSRLRHSWKVGVEGEGYKPRKQRKLLFNLQLTYTSPYSTENDHDLKIYISDYCNSLKLCTSKLRPKLFILCAEGSNSLIASLMWSGGYTLQGQSLSHLIIPMHNQSHPEDRARCLIFVIRRVCSSFHICEWGVYL